MYLTNYSHTDLQGKSTPIWGSILVNIMVLKSGTFHLYLWFHVIFYSIIINMTHFLAYFRLGQKSVYSTNGQIAATLPVAPSSPNNSTENGVQSSSDKWLRNGSNVTAVQLSSCDLRPYHLHSVHFHLTNWESQLVMLWF